MSGGDPPAALRLHPHAGIAQVGRERHPAELAAQRRTRKRHRALVVHAHCLFLDLQPLDPLYSMAMRVQVVGWLLTLPVASTKVRSSASSVSSTSTSDASMASRKRPSSSAITRSVIASFLA